MVRSSGTSIFCPRVNEGADSRVSSFARGAFGYAPGPGLSAALSRSPYAPSLEPRTPMVKLGPVGGLFEPSPSYSPGPMSRVGGGARPSLVLPAIVNAGAEGRGLELDPRTS